MKFLRLIFFLALTAGAIWKLDTPTGALPAMGRLLNPFTGFWQNGENAVLKTFPDREFEALKGKVSVQYDDRMVPHVFAENTADALFVQGYLHAANRLFEMDMITRAAGGMLSELVGTAALDYDKQKRHLGMLWAAENDVAAWKKDAEMTVLMDSYVAGANAYISSLSPKDYPLEYKFLGAKPAPWSMLRSALFNKVMAEDLCSRNSDLEASNSKTMFGKDFDALFPEYFKEQSPIVPTGTKWGFSPVAGSGTAAPKTSTSSTNHHSSNDALSYLDFPIYEKPDAGNGSNNWAVDGGKTLSKHPILCGDPHLSLRLPSIWYEIQMTTPEMNVYGVSFPGVPFVTIGFNENIAWSPTNVGHDVADWYSIQWKDAKKRDTYILDGMEKKADLRVERIAVQGFKEPVLDTVRYTTWGPVVFESDTSMKVNMAYHWLGHDVPKANPLRAFYLLNKAKNYDDYLKALEFFDLPAQNFAFACKNGDIALKVNGNLPIKSKEQGRFLQDGSKSANAWHGFIPREQLPSYKNPSRGFVSSANQHSTDPTYPYYYNTETFDTYRGRNINRKLTQMDSITAKDMAKLQTDNSSLLAEEALPQLFKNLDSNSLSAPEKAYLTQLRQWNLHYEATDFAPILFTEWFKNVYTATWDEVNESKTPKPAQLLRPSEWRTIELLKNEPKSIYFDLKATPAREAATEIVTQGFKDMAKNVTAAVVKYKITDPKGSYIWAKHQDLNIYHLLRKATDVISPMDAFSRLHVVSSGHGKSINAVRNNHGPSWRMIVELGDSVKAFVAYPGGQSGNPGSRHYDEFLDKWAKGEYYEAVFLRNAAEKNKRIVLTQQFSKPAKK